MATTGKFLRGVARWMGRVMVALAFAAGVVVLLLWLAGKFEPKVSDEPTARQPEETAVPGTVVPARLVSLHATESAVGTIRAVHEIVIGSKLLARVTEVNLKAGQIVRTGDVLVRLDDADLQAKLQQAKAAVASARAVQARAVADERRYAQLTQSRAVSQQEYDRAKEAKGTAEADLQRAEANVNEVQAMLDWATICSPINGTVIDKKADVGDMVSPGQPLATLYDPRECNWWPAFGNR